VCFKNSLRKNSLHGTGSARLFAFTKTQLHHLTEEQEPKSITTKLHTMGEQDKNRSGTAALTPGGGHALPLASPLCGQPAGGTNPSFTAPHSDASHCRAAARGASGLVRLPRTAAMRPFPLPGGPEPGMATSPPMELAGASDLGDGGG
jgi:hypothetical protein